MEVFDNRMTELERKLADYSNGTAISRDSDEYRALLIRLAQMKAFRPNLARLPRHEQWNCIAYLVQYASKSHRDIIVPPHDDDEYDDDYDN